MLVALTLEPLTWRFLRIVSVFGHPRAPGTDLARSGPSQWHGLSRPRLRPTLGARRARRKPGTRVVSQSTDRTTRRSALRAHRARGKPGPVVAALQARALADAAEVFRIRPPCRGGGEEREESREPEGKQEDSVTVPPKSFEPPPQWNIVAMCCHNAMLQQGPAEGRLTKSQLARLRPHAFVIGGSPDQRPPSAGDPHHHQKHGENSPAALHRLADRSPQRCSPRAHPRSLPRPRRRPALRAHPVIAER